jgi:hypothetical protein
VAVAPNSPEVESFMKIVEQQYPRLNYSLYQVGPGQKHFEHDFYSGIGSCAGEKIDAVPAPTQLIKGPNF